MTDDEIDDELADMLEDTDVNVDSLERIDRDDAERFTHDEPTNDDVTAILAGHLAPTDDDGRTDYDAFYDGEQPITVGRVLYDTQSEQYCAVREASHDSREVTVGHLRRTDHGPHETPHGAFEPTDDTLTVDWPSEGGRFIPK